MKAKILVYALPVLILTIIHLAEAQQAKKVPRIGYLTAASASAMVPRVNAFRQGLRELGYVEGKNILIEYQYADGKLDRLPALAAELVRLNIDIIVSGGPAATRPAEESNFYHTYYHGAGWRSCWKWVRGQSRATGRKHHGIIDRCT